jgi:CDP-4-dehydro-6-deoxyglucose reductase
LQARLVSSLDLAPDVRHFEFEIADGNAFPFTPGQFVSVKEQVAGKEVTRAYSIASPPNGNRFALCLNRVAEGLVSPRMFALKPGEHVEVNEPLGYFTLRQSEKPAVFIGTGTGIAPFRSILLNALPQSGPITLLFGARHPHGVLYREEFEELAQRHPHFRFIPTITRPDDAWSGGIGRVQAHLDAALAHHETTPDVYICGMKEMVDDVRALLKQKGFERKQIIYEKYD